MLGKQVKSCHSCGFLALHGIGLLPKLSLALIKTAYELGLFALKECTQIGRDAIENGTHPDVYSLTCARHVWSGSNFKGKSMSYAFRSLTLERKCRYFFPYTSGYSPAEHRELQREAKTHRLLTRNMILAGIIGAGAAILAQHLAR